MTKLLYFSLLCLCLPGLAFSQLKPRQSFVNPKTEAIKEIAHRQHIHNLLQNQEESRVGAMEPAAKTSASLQERLIAFSVYDYYLPDTINYPLGKTDTGILKYSNGRGSKFNYYNMGYDFPANFYNDGSIISQFNGGFRSTYADPNYRPGVLCDSFRGWGARIATYSIPMYVYGYTDSEYVVYDAHNNVVTYNDQTFPDVPGIDDIWHNTWDANNNNITSLEVQYNPGIPVYDTIGLSVHVFSGGKLIEDSLNYGCGTYGPIEKWLYSYNLAGNLTHASFYTDSSGIWIEKQQYFITYNIDNTLKTDSETVIYSGVWLPNLSQSFTYTPGVSYYTSSTLNSYSAGYSVGQKIVSTKHIGTLGLPDTLYQYTYFDPTGTAMKLTYQDKSAFTYDTYKNPKVEYTYHYNITDSVTGAGYYDAAPENFIYYFYETYLSTGIEAPGSSDKITLFPNPSSNTVTISWPGVHPGSNTKIGISNVAGQTVFTENRVWNGETTTISLSGLSEGIYILRIEDRDNHVVFGRKIMKR